MKRAIVYARISVTTEESVSVERQIKSAQQYADALGWQVVGTFADDGVSATKNKPEDRTGWKSVLEAAPQADVVLIWKIDRLARNVSDFMRAQWALEEHGAGLASVTEGLDLTTTIGQMVATNLAYFAQMEAEAISARSKAARHHLIRSGRAVGGSVQYGWRTVPNPDGPGVVLAHDPETIEFVRGAVERTLAGRTIYSTVLWLDDQSAPLPRNSQGKRRDGGWRYPSVERMLRNPILAGMIPFNPNNSGQKRGADVLRGDDGLPVVDESLAIMSVADWRHMIDLITDRPRARVQPRGAEIGSRSSALLSRLVYCGDPRHGDDMPRMHRATADGREGYTCKKCHQQITSFEPLVIEEFLRQKGTWPRWTKVEEFHEGGAALLPEIERRLDELDGLIRDAASREERAGWQTQQADLLDERDARRSEAPAVSLRYEPAGLFADEWGAATTPEAKRAVLVDALDRLVVRRGGVGRRSPAQVLKRLEFRWHSPEQVGEPEDRTTTG
jgi:site-specific DNA recombinase